jgi:hypothetical protein
MTTHIPRQFYSQEELERLYPKELELQLVQIVRLTFNLRPLTYLPDIMLFG